MKPIEKTEVQKEINRRNNEECYVHLETTNGAYTGYHDKSNLSVGAYIRNAKVCFSQGKIMGEGPYRVGLKMDIGWIYAEGLTDWEVDEENRLLLAGHNKDGKMAVALELSHKPFE